MRDVECPYCGEEQEINHDDGYGYEEGVTHQELCSECEKYFAYTTHVSFDYYAKKADCMNGEPHNFQPVVSVPKLWPNWVRCVDCEHEIRGEYVEPNKEGETL